MPSEQENGMAEHRIVVVGAGFAGVELVKKLNGAPASITLIDRRNHHLFQPLLYQVASSILSPAEIAWPIRQIFRDRGDVEVLLGEVVAVDRDKRQVLLREGETVDFDTLVLATGVRHAYFGHDEWQQFAPGLKTCADATTIRNQILTAFERAERSPEAPDRVAQTTFVVVGGGPTGVELAGIIADLAKRALPREFRRANIREARVVLIEAGPRILPTFEPGLSEAARQALERRGVELLLGAPVTACSAEGVMVGGQLLPSRTVVWAAGVTASPAARWIGSASDRAGRANVEADLTIASDPAIFVIGDTASIRQPDSSIVPGLAPAAKQQGAYVAKVIRSRLLGRAQGAAFQYKHQGSLATIGHRAAVADLGWIKLKGYPAWWVWGIVHIFFLIGARSRIAVAVSWFWTYLKGQPTARIIDEEPHVPAKSPP
jgi:NADH dehydrogenase